MSQTITGHRLSDAARFDDGVRRRVKRAREEFFESRTLNDAASVVGSEIVHSWRRSLESGVDPVGSILPTVRLGPHRARRLTAAAAPVMERLAQQSRDSEAWGLLLDRECVQVYGIAGDERRVREGEEHGGGVGAVYHESTVGTNGAGISLERLEPFMVVGAEHFRESEHNLVSVGVPLRDTIGRLAGLLMMCHRLSDANHLIVPYALSLAGSINEQLATQTDRDERILFDEFSRHSTRPSLPVVAMSDQVFVANASAQQLLRDIAHTDLLRNAALEAAQGGRSRFITLQLGDVRYRVHCRVVSLSRGRAGVVASLSRAEETAGSQEARMPTSPHTARLTSLRRARSLGLAALVVGERGSGRGHLVRSLGAVTELSADLASLDTAGWLIRLSEALRTSSVFVRDIDALDPATMRTAAALIRESTSWCVGTAQANTLDEVFPVVITCPALRTRTGEIHDVVAQVLSDIGGESLRCDDEVMSVLVRHEWPGNVSQLRRVLASAVLASRTGGISLEHLPKDIATGGRSMGMTQMVRAEREMVFDALRNAEWNRDRAAGTLGISRATLYRKIKQFSFQLPSSRGR